MPWIDTDDMDMWWYCPTLFSVFKPKELLELLTCLILGKSLVFVSDNLPVLSNVVLGLETLIRPLTWSYVVIPVLSDILSDRVYAPTPLLVGLT